MSRENPLIVENILQRVKSHLGLKTDGELAEQLGLGQTAISAWKKRGSINLDLVITNCAGADMNWLLFGERGANQAGGAEDYSQAGDNGVLDIAMATSPVDLEGMAFDEVQERMMAAKLNGEVQYYVRMSFQKLRREDVEGRGEE